MAVYNFDDVKTSDHAHLAGQLMVPLGEHCNTQRGNMLLQHLSQYMQLAKPEVPKVFTNFENSIGRWSTNGYKKIEQDCIILKKFQKNKYNYSLLVQYKYSKKYDLLHFKCYDHIGAISESYGTEMIEGTEVKNATPGSELHAGDYLTRTPSYDDDGNFMYGVNLKSVYMPWYGLTHEDAIVITESAAEKLKSYKIKEIEVKIGSNNVFLDLYNTGETNTYHSFPHIGEYTNGKILVASRQKNNKTLLYEFQHERMKEIDPNDHIVFCPYNSKCVDIDIYTSKTPEELRATSDMFLCEIADELEMQNKYWNEIKDALEEIIPVATNEEIESIMSETEKHMFRGELANFKTQIERPLPYTLNNNSYTDEVGYYWKLSHEYCNRKIKWRDEGRVIDNIRMKFTLLQEDNVSVGLKITGRSN